MITVFYHILLQYFNYSRNFNNRDRDSVRIPDILQDVVDIRFNYNFPEIRHPSIVCKVLESEKIHLLFK